MIMVRGRRSDRVCAGSISMVFPASLIPRVFVGVSLLIVGDFEILPFACPGMGIIFPQFLAIFLYPDAVNNSYL